MSHVVSSSAPITSSHTVKQYAGFGILGADIPTTGDNGGSPVLNDSINPTSEYHWRVETPPSAGVLTIYPDLTFEWDATGVPDGSYPWAYRLFEDGTDDGTATVSQTVGSGGISADLAATEAGDTLSVSASVPLSASLSYTEFADSVSGSSAVTIHATATLTEAGDSVSGVSVVSITATASIAESADSLSASGTVVAGINATLSVTEAADTLAAVANAAISATLSATESGDTLAAQASVALSAALDAVEAGDTVVSSVGISITCSASLSEDGDTLTATASIISDSNTITAASMIRLAEIWARMELDAANPLVTSATQLTVGTIAQDISTGGAVRTGATMVPTIDPDTMIAEVWQRLGLDPDNALTQTNTNIDVGNIHLTVSGTNTLTVQRV